MDNSLTEPWLRGPLPGISPLLQPAAFALIQSQEDVAFILADFNAKNLWIKPAGRASVAFHLQHMCGVLYRMTVYAEGNTLSEGQFKALAEEGLERQDITFSFLSVEFNKAIDNMLEYLKHVDESTLTQPRTVGREKRPSTVIGTLFHAAEHVQRHTGQLLVTVSVFSHLKEFNP